MLDMRCLEFSNGILAASALFHFSSLELVENVTGIKKKKNSAWAKVSLKQMNMLRVLFVMLLLVVSRLCCHDFVHSSFCPHSSEEGGGRGVREVDGAFRHGAAGGWWVAYENIHRYPCWWHAQHPDPCLLHYMAGKWKWTMNTLIFSDLMCKAGRTENKPMKITAILLNLKSSIFLIRHLTNWVCCC